MNIVVVPLLFGDAEKRMFMLEGQGRPCTESVLRAVAASPLAGRVHVLVDDPMGAALAAACGLPATGAPPAPTEKWAGFLPPELEGARRWLGDMARSEDLVMAISPRAPLLTSAMLEQASEAFASSDALFMLSVTSPRDHPCQYKQFFWVQGMTHLHFVEENWGGAVRDAGLAPSFRATRPFPVGGPLPEAARSAVRLWCRERNGFLLRFMEAEPDASARVYWTFPEAGTARVLFDPERIGSHLPEGVALAGVDLPGPDECSSMVAYREGGALRVHMRAEGLADGDIVRIYPLGPRNRCWPSHEERLRLPASLVTVPVPDRDVFGALVLVLRESHDGRYDFEAPFLPDDSLWRIDRLTHDIVNSDTGKVVVGRQDFIDLHQPDGAFFVARGRALRAPEQWVDMHAVQPFRLPPEDSLRVETIFDVEMYRLRVEGLAGHSRGCAADTCAPQGDSDR